jgi:Flp pilus assembly pilin Flp
LIIGLIAIAMMTGLQQLGGGVGGKWGGLANTMNTYMP